MKPVRVLIPNVPRVYVELKEMKILFSVMDYDFRLK